MCSRRRHLRKPSGASILFLADKGLSNIPCKLKERSTETNELRELATSVGNVDVTDRVVHFVGTGDLVQWRRALPPIIDKTSGR